LLSVAGKASDISLLPLPEGVERSVRESGDARIAFYLNLSKNSQRVESAPGGKDALDGSSVPRSFELPPMGVRIVIE
jgi:hypothetical protein